MLSLSAVLAVSDAAWLHRDTMPPRWDESVHMLAAERIRQCRPGQELAVAMGESFYPPFVPMVGAAVATVLGPSDDGYAGSMVLFLVILVGATAGVATTAFGPAAGLVAAALAGTAPLITREVHGFMLDVPLAALVMLVTWLLQREAFALPTRAVVAGLVCGFALLTKWTAAVYLAGPIAFHLVREARGGGRRAARRGAGLFAAGAAAVCGYWYALNLSTILETGWRAAYLDPAVAGAPLASPAALTLYPRVLAWGAPCTVVVLLLALPRLWRVRERRWLLGSLVLPLVLLGGLRNKNDRYAIPLIPFASVAASAVAADGVARAQRRRWAAVVTAAALVVHSSAAMAWPAIPGLSHAPRAEAWPLEDILRVAAARCSGCASLAVIPDHPYLNPSNLMLLAMRGHIPVEVRGFEGAPGDSRLCLVKTGDAGNGAIERWIPPRRDLTRELLTGTRRGSAYREWRRWPLPDGSAAVLFHLRASAPGR